MQQRGGCLAARMCGHGMLRDLSLFATPTTSPSYRLACSRMRSTADVNYQPRWPHCFQQMSSKNADLFNTLCEAQDRMCKPPTATRVHLSSELRKAACNAQRSILAPTTLLYAAANTFLSPAPKSKCCCDQHAGLWDAHSELPHVGTRGLLIRSKAGYCLHQALKRLIAVPVHFDVLLCPVRSLILYCGAEHIGSGI